MEHQYLAPAETRSFKICPETYQFVYIITGEGSLSMDADKLDDSKRVKADDCFSFPVQANMTSYSIRADDSGVEIFVVSDIERAGEGPIKVSVFDTLG